MADFLRSPGKMMMLFAKTPRPGLGSRICYGFSENRISMDILIYFVLSPIPIDYEDYLYVLYEN